MSLSDICPVHHEEHAESVDCKDCGTRLPVRHCEDDSIDDLCEGCHAERQRVFWKRIGVRK